MNVMQRQLSRMIAFLIWIGPSFAASLRPATVQAMSPAPPLLALPRHTEILNLPPPNAPEAAGDALWDDRFDALGLNAPTFSIAVNGTDVYVGGGFTAAGLITTSRIAKWNSLAGSWAALGNGVNGPVNVIAISGTQVYVGGSFTAASGVTGTKAIARWDGATWSALSIGITGTVQAIAISGTEVYVGGTFSGLVDGVPGTRHLACWNGSAWSAVGSGVSGPVLALAASGGDLYVGGSFTTAIGVSNTAGLARWNGAAWSGLGGGISGTVNAIATISNDVYVGGSFTSASGISGTKNIAQWNANTGWLALGDGANFAVNALAASGSQVYAGGNFTLMSGVTNTLKVARWDTTAGNWSALGSGVSGNINALGVGLDGVYVAGFFSSVAPKISGATGGKASRNIALWHTNIPDPDANWDANFGVPGIPGVSVATGSIRAIAVSGNNVYFGGDFTSIGGISATNVARWNPVTGWSNMAGGVYNPPGLGIDAVYAIAANGDDVYVGGAFSRADHLCDTNAPCLGNLARWNEQSGTWWKMGHGVNGGVLAIAIGSDGVYVGGGFSRAYNCQAAHTCPPGVPLSITAQYVARWRNGLWSHVGGGIDPYSLATSVRAIATSGNDVYVGGDFASASGIPAQNIAKWNSATLTWTALISGTQNGVSGIGGVDAIAITGTQVYLGGRFIYAGGATVYRLARWNGSRYWPLGQSVNGAFIYDIAIRGDEVYIVNSGPKAFNADGSEVVINTIGKWNRANERWSSLGTGVQGNTALAIGLAPDGVYVGGYFSLAGNKPSKRIGLWHTSPVSAPVGSIAGRVLGPNDVPITGAQVQACLSPTGRPCQNATTNAQGNYLITGLADGPYLLRAFPSRGSCNLPGTLGPVTVANGAAVSGQDIVLSVAQGLPAGTTLLPASGACVPVVDWSVPLTLQTQGCPGGSASYQILNIANTIIRSGAMTETVPGQYSATITPFRPLSGYATVHIAIQCPSGPSQAIAFTLYIDPSGYVRTIFGEPVVSATVTLYAFDTALGDFVLVPDGDATMSPSNRANPDLTDASGHFGWDVIAGVYKVRAEKAGCVSPNNAAQAFVESDLLTIPPPITDLDLRLDCGSQRLYLPLAQRDDAPP